MVSAITKVLGVLFDSKLNFQNRTEMTENEAMRALGFIKRTIAAPFKTRQL